MKTIFLWWFMDNNWHQCWGSFMEWDGAEWSYSWKNDLHKVNSNVGGCACMSTWWKRKGSCHTLWCWNGGSLHTWPGSWIYAARNIYCPPPLSHHPTEAPAHQRPRLCCLRDLFSHLGDTALLQYACVGGSTWNAITHYSPATVPLPAASKYESRKNHWHILLRHSRIFIFLQHTLSSEQSSLRSVNYLWLTFLHGACRHGFAVRTLELIEIWPHLNLVDNSFFQPGESYIPLRGDLQVLYLPRPWGGQAWGLPEQNAVALNKLRWILHLREEAEESGIQTCFMVITWEVSLISV